MEACEVSGKEMDDFKQEVRSEIREMSQSIRDFSAENARSSAETAGAVRELVGAIKTLTENDIRRQEREEMQEEKHAAVVNDIRILKEFREETLLSRAKESNAREWLSKNYPWLVVIVALATIYISKFPIK